MKTFFYNTFYLFKIISTIISRIVVHYLQDCREFIEHDRYTSSSLPLCSKHNVDTQELLFENPSAICTSHVNAVPMIGYDLDVEMNAEIVNFNWKLHNSL